MALSSFFPARHLLRHRSLVHLATRFLSSASAARTVGALLRDRAYVNGCWVSAGSGAEFEVLDPGSRDVICKVPDMSRDDTVHAVQTAHEAFGHWCSLTPSERCQRLLEWERLLLSKRQELATLVAWESGKAIKEAEIEVAYGASFLGWFAEEAKRVVGQTLHGPTKDKRILTLRQPQGVCGMITPWNFPIAMITRKAGAALAAGCTAVIKPAEDTPLSALALCQLAEEAGIPAGCINVVTCSQKSAAEVGAVLTTHELVRHVSFTGSTSVGKLLLSQCSGTVKRASMELGGNAPFLVFEDANLEAAVSGLMAAKFRNSGQTCVCPNRVFVHAAVATEFADRLTAAAAKLKVGHGLNPNTDLGPLINDAAGEKLKKLVHDAVDKGANVLLGGANKLRISGGEAGCFYGPTVLTDVPTTALCFSEEIFGPLIAIFPFNSEAEAVRLSNDTRVGLAGYFYSRDASRCWRVAEALQVGMVGVNEPAISSCLAPFGGVRESGLGRESGVGYGIEEYLDLKTVTWNVTN